MYSKKITGILLLMSLLSSCSWLRDKPKAQKSFESGELDLSCLQVMPTQLKELFAGNYTESARDQEEVKAIWKCLDRSLNTFSKYTHGSNAAHYTDMEMKDFANRYLPNDSLFSESLVFSIFKLKTAVLGGTNQNITQNEILKLRSKLNRFGEIILPLAPYISILLKPYDNLTDDKIQIAGDRLNKFVAEFADLLSDSENTVTWLNLSSFVGELEKYLKAPNPTALTVVREQMKVFQYLKLLAVGGDELGIENTKWKPIFKSISTIYNALYLTTTSGEMMEQLGIEIQSSEEEQRKATAKLTEVLKTLKNDDTLYTKATIQLLADRWSKVLILNAFLYPKSQDKIAVKEFLGSPKIRYLTALLMDDLILLRSGNHSVKLVEKIADNLILLLEQTGKDQNSTLILESLGEYLIKMKPLFTNQKDFEIIDTAISLLKDISSILIGNHTGKLNSKDFSALILKAKDLYTVWGKQNQSEFNQSLSTSLEILIRQPNSALITVLQLKSFLQKCETLFSKLTFNTEVNWAQINKAVVDGARLKSILFDNTDQNITQFELTQLLNTWNAFVSKKELDEVLENLAKFFKNNPYSSVKISELMGALDAFLPVDKKLSVLGITPELIGTVKEFLIGGSSTILDRNEYNTISQVGFTVFRRLTPVIKSLPKDFKLGLNSTSFSLFEAAIQGLVDDKNLSFSNAALKNLLLTQLNKPGMKVTEPTIERLLIGLNHRVLDRSKSAKPKTYPSHFSSAKLAGIAQFLERTKSDYLDFESAFAGTPKTQSIPGLVIMKKLNRAGSKIVLGSLHPIVSGQTSMPYFTGKGQPQTDYYLDDLYYKDLLFNALMWIFPAYEIESDPTKPNKMPRLSSNDLIDLFDDVNDAVYELGMSFSLEPSAASATKRMQSINLFTRTGNGDDYIDIIETVDFLTTTLAGKNLLAEVRKDLVKSCYPKTTAYRAQEKFSHQCLKNEFFSKNKFSNTYQKVVPLMSEHYMSLNASQQEEFRKSTLTAVNARWKENVDFDLSDLETLVSIPYYIENIFLRLDHDFNGVLSFTEAMSGFPVFCREIKKSAGDSIRGSCELGEKPRQVEAIYGHLLMKGTAPRSVQPNDSVLEKARIIKDFLVWNFAWKHLDRDPAVRDQLPPFLYRKDLLNIISNLSTSIAPATALVPPSVDASSE